MNEPTPNGRIELPPALRSLIEHDLAAGHAPARADHPNAALPPYRRSAARRRGTRLRHSPRCSTTRLRLTWGASILQLLLSLLLIVLALREAIPGTTLSRHALVVTFGAGLAAVARHHLVDLDAQPHDRRAPRGTGRLAHLPWRHDPAGAPRARPRRLARRQRLPLATATRRRPLRPRRRPDGRRRLAPVLPLLRPRPRLRCPHAGNPDHHHHRQPPLRPLASKDVAHVLNGLEHASQGPMHTSAAPVSTCAPRASLAHCAPRTRPASRHLRICALAHLTSPRPRE